jgi:co-chaperonin GroES (HSP10)
MQMRCYADNVLLELEPLPTMTAGGLYLPQQTQRGASGPGHYLQRSGGAGSTVERSRAFKANQTKPGDRVVVDAQAGQSWEGELSVPRHNQGQEFGNLRVVREDEILGIIEDAETA